MNIGGYDKNSFSESSGNRILGEILEQTQLIKVHFTENDKTPNFDGTFEICECTKAKKVPIGRFNVQIKTMSTDYKNYNKSEQVSDYKYPCDTKIFNSVKNGISCDPAILFLVDIKDRRVYFIHVSYVYALSLNIDNEDTKTIYFNETDRLDEEDSCGHFTQIFNEYKRLIYNEKDSLLTTSKTLDKETIEELQEIIDNFNNVLSNELSFIKKHFYRNVWKFGIAYVKHNNDFATIGIYTIRKGENGALIRRFSKEEEDACETISYYRLSHKSTKEIINDILFSIIDDYFGKAYIDPQYLPNIVLEEIAFYFLDTLSYSCDSYAREEQRNTYYKNVVSTEEIEHLWNSLIEYSIEALSSSPACIEPLDHPSVIVDPLTSLENGFGCEKRRELFKKINSSLTEVQTTSFTLVLGGKFAYRLVQRSILELKHRNILTVSRVWAPKHFVKFFEELQLLRISGINRHETGYVLADFSANMQKILSVLTRAYIDTAQNLFGKYSDTIAIKREYIIRIEPTHEAKCILIELPSTEFKTSQTDSLNRISEMNVFDSARELYPNCNSVTQTYLCSAFSHPYPLYQNISYLIKKSIYVFYEKSLQYSPSFRPIIN